MTRHRHDTEIRQLSHLYLLSVTFSFPVKRFSHGPKRTLSFSFVFESFEREPVVVIEVFGHYWCVPTLVPCS